LDSNPRLCPGAAGAGTAAAAAALQAGAQLSSRLNSVPYTQMARKRTGWHQRCVAGMSHARMTSLPALTWPAVSQNFALATGQVSASG
jgi:hypothetical protein